VAGNQLWLRRVASVRVASGAGLSSGRSISFSFVIRTLYVSAA
jgi:hypothetical protein